MLCLAECQEENAEVNPLVHILLGSPEGNPEGDCLMFSTEIKRVICVSACLCAYMHIYMRICVHLYYVYIYMCACMHTCCVSILCVHVYMNVCEYVCIYTNKMYIFVCAYTDIFIIYTNKTEGLMLVWIETRTSSTLFFAFFLHYVEAFRGTIGLRLIIHLESEEYRRAHLMIRTSKHTTS